MGAPRRKCHGQSCRDGPSLGHGPSLLPSRFLTPGPGEWLPRGRTSPWRWCRICAAPACLVHPCARALGGDMWAPYTSSDLPLCVVSEIRGTTPRRCDGFNALSVTARRVPCVCKPRCARIGRPRPLRGAHPAATCRRPHRERWGEEERFWGHAEPAIKKGPGKEPGPMRNIRKIMKPTDRLPCPMYRPWGGRAH